MHRKPSVCVAAVAATAALAPATASAALTDAAAAAATTAAAQAAAAASYNGADITCAPESDGGLITSQTNFVVGKLFAEDFGVGQAKCISLTAKTYTITATTSIQSFHLGVWQNVGCSASRSATATQGVAVVAAVPVTCNYGDNSTYLDEYHRSHTVLTNTVDGVPRDAYSATWFVRRG